MKDESIIPKGIYCHDADMKPCPYWSLDKAHEYQNNGYCSFLEDGDWTDSGIWLLWEQIKECGINEGDFEEKNNDA